MSLPPLPFVLGLHLHQPIGNFGFVFEKAYTQSYLPFMEALERHPAVRCVYHITGPLLEWIEAAHPDFLDRLGALVARGQVEMMGGSFYESILVVTPEQDRQHQLARMRGWIRERWGVEARGAWLAERIWEPSLVGTLVTAGIDHVVLDDSHFHAAGVPADRALGWWATEDLGRTLAVFPISKRMRYRVPFHPVEEVIGVLQERAALHNGRALTLMDDGEKFGLWPGTRDWVYGSGWLERFLGALSDAQREGWLTMRPFSEVLRETPPEGRVSLPMMSYFEMGEWSLPADAGRKLAALHHRAEHDPSQRDFLEFLRGGNWRNFLTKYDEAARLHKRMLMVSRRVHAAPESPEREAALTALLRAQCNCGYWHGIFGGIYFPHLRHAIYANLLEADRRLEAIEHGDRPFRIIQRQDLDGDNQPEIDVSDPAMRWVLSPHRGGALLWLEQKHPALEWLNTFSRYAEAYYPEAPTEDGEGPDRRPATIHDQVRTLGPDLWNLTRPDPAPRLFAQDRWLPADVTLADFEQGPSAWAVEGPASIWNVEMETDPDRVRLRLSRRLDAVPLEMVKTLTARCGTGRLGWEWIAHNASSQVVEGVWAVEFNVGLMGGRPDGAVLAEGAAQAVSIYEETEIVSSPALSLESGWNAARLRLERDGSGRWWHAPIFTVSQSEAGFEKIYQGSRVVALWPLRLEAGQSIAWRLTAELVDTGKDPIHA